MVTNVKIGINKVLTKKEKYIYTKAKLPLRKSGALTRRSSIILFLEELQFQSVRSLHNILSIFNRNLCEIAFDFCNSRRRISLSLGSDMAFVVTSLIFAVVGIIASICTRICFNKGPSTNLYVNFHSFLLLLPLI